VSKALPKQFTYETKNRWRSGDTHSQHRAATVWLSLSPIKAADMLIMDNSKQIASQTTYLQRPKIVDAPLTLIFSLGLLTCQFLLCLKRLAIRRLWITVSISPPKPLTYKTKYCWRSVDSHFQHGAVTVSLSLLPIKAAYTLVMDNSEQIASQLTHLQDRKSFMLHRHSSDAHHKYVLKVVVWSIILYK